MKQLLSLFCGLAFFAAASTTHAQIEWAAGAPNGTPGGSIELTAGDGVFLDTGVAAALVGGDRTTPVDYTVSAWINSNQGNAFGEAADDYWWFGTGAQGIHLGIFDGSKLRVGHWGADNSGTSVVTADTWVHATYTFDADGGTVDAVTGVATGLISIYRDGVLETSVDSLAPNNATTNLIIGSRNGAGGPSWSGFIDDVAIFTTALSAADVANLAADTTQAVSLGAGAYYNFDEGTGTTTANQGSLGLSALDGIAAPLPPVAAWATGAPGGTSGGAVQFDGTGNLETGIASALVGANRTDGGLDYTVSAWLYSSNESVDFPGNAANNHWWLGTTNQGIHMGVFSPAADVTANGGSTLRIGHWSADNSGTTVVPVNTWVHATHSFDADGGTVDPVTGVATGLVSVYYNGVLEGSYDALAPNVSDTDLIIGARANGGGWIGSIDDLTIFTSLLSAADIATLAGDASQAVTLGAAAYYNFEDSQTGTTAANLVSVATSGLTGSDGSPALQELDRIGAANTVLKGDVDLSGEVTFLDIQPFIGILSSGGYQAEADCDCDGDVDFLDIAPFIVILSQ